MYVENKQSKTKKRTRKKSALVKHINIGSYAAGWVEKNSNLNSWRGRVRPEHSI